MKSLIFLTAFSFSFIAQAASENLLINCDAVETQAESVQYTELKVSRSPTGELNYTGSSEKYQYTVIFHPPQYEDYWMLIETKPAFKPTYHAEGSLSPRPRDPLQKMALLEFYTDALNVRLQCVKKNSTRVR